MWIAFLKTEQSQNPPFRVLDLLSQAKGIFHILPANGPINTFPTCVFTTERWRGERKRQCFPFYFTSFCTTSISPPRVDKGESAIRFRGKV